MSAIAIGGVVFVRVFGGALLRVFLQSALPEHRASSDTKDVVKLALGALRYCPHPIDRAPAMIEVGISLMGLGRVAFEPVDETGLGGAQR